MNLLELEQRILYSAAPVGDLDGQQHADLELNSIDPAASDNESVSDILIGAVDFSDGSESATADLAGQTTNPPGGEPLELIVIDSGIENHDLLIESISNQIPGDKSFEWLILDSSQDGVDLISDVLSTLANVSAVHVFSHGNNGEISLGNSLLSSSNLDAYAGQIASWNQSLGNDADILFYGCSLAETASGRTMLEAISELCDCDVAASEDLTGDAEQGGDWELEYQLGNIDVRSIDLAFDSIWSGVLATTAVGSEFLVNTTTSNIQTTSFDGLPAVASDSDGNSLVVWSSFSQDGDGWGIYGQRYDENGNTVGSEFAINQTTANDQQDAAVAMADNGNAAVVWASELQDGSGFGIYARVYFAGGGSTNEILVNTILSGDQKWPSVAMDATGNFVVTWTSLDANDTGVMAQRFDSSGTKLGNEFQVNTNTSGKQENSTVAMDDAGNFVITWSSENQDGSGWGVYAQRYDTNGNALGSEFLVNSGNTTSDQWYSRVAMDADGDFVITWESDHTGNFNVYAQQYYFSGAQHGSEILVNSYTGGVQQSSGVAMDDAGNFFVTWESNLQDGGGFGIYAQEFKWDGTADGSEYLVNTTTIGGQRIPSIASDNDGDLFIVWAGNGAGDASGVFGQRYETETFTVINTNDSGKGSFRDAILRSNTRTGTQTIEFNIAGSGVHTINLSSSLPDITDTVIVDGFSEPDYVAGSPVIELDGQGLFSDGIFLDTGSDGSSIRGLIINNFTDDGIDIESSNNTIVGNWIGINNTGSAAAGNGDEGIEITTSGNVIGGLSYSERNVISGNDERGIYISGVGATFNTIIGNFVGTDRFGTTAVANLAQGIYVQGGANNNTIGGSASGSRNIISGNNDDGVRIDGLGTSANKVLGNFIGTDVTGTQDLGNADDGIQIHNLAAGNTIGGATAAERNVISGNDDDGVQLSDLASGNVVQGNYVGTDVTGSSSIGNFSDGVTIESGATGNTIGGTANGAGNVIAYSGDDGINMNDAATTGNSFLGNVVYGSIDFEIDLGGDGVSANDPGDVDTGENNLQNFPVLTTALTNGSSITVTGSLNAAANTTFRIEFFASTSANSSGHGGAERYLGFGIVTTDGSGNVSFSSLLSASVSDGEYVTATATEDLGGGNFGDTSEFAQNITAMSNVMIVDTTSDVADGDTSSISALLLDKGSDGFISLREAILAANNTANAGAPDQIHFAIAANDPNHFYYQDDGIAGQVSSAMIATTTAASDASIVGIDPDFAKSWYSIQVGSIALPTINEAVVIDATTQTNYSGTPIVELDGSGQTAGTEGFRIESDGSTIAGFVINGLTNDPGPPADHGEGILILNANNNTIRDNYIGTDVSGTIAIGNAGTGVMIMNGDGNVIDGNLISGNQSGIEIKTGSANNVVTGNLIGTDAAGQVALANAADGIIIFDAANNNVIGGTAIADRNVISGNDGDGIEIAGLGSDSNQVLGNYIGLAADGSSALGNAGDGVHISLGAKNNVIGDTASGSRNVISGNAFRGVQIEGVGSTNNTVIGNYIGTDAAGLAAVGNVSGVFVANGATNNTIGGVTTAHRNLISGNTTHGVRIQDAGTSNNRIIGNWIGVDAIGSAMLANGTYGISVGSNADTVYVGGSNAGEGNLIAGGTFAVSLWNGGDNSFVEGNYIGTNASGTSRLTGGNIGVHLDGVDNVTVGGATASHRNIIATNSTSVWMSAGTTNSIVQGNFMGTDHTGTIEIGRGGMTVNGVGNDGNTVQDNVIAGAIGTGLFIEATNLIVTGNKIGTDVSGTVDFGGSSDAIRVGTGASNVQIGGVNAGEANTIAYNNGTGIRVDASAGTGIEIRGNSIHSNAGMGIDLGHDGVTGNDALDVDTGPNNLINFADLGSATNTSGNITIVGNYHGLANETITLDFYWSTTQDVTGYGEAENYLGTTTIVTDASGNATINVLFAVAVPNGAFVTSTATDTNGNTSEFSQNVIADENNDAPVFSGLDGSPSYTEDGSPVVIDDNVTVYDEELSGADNFNGSSLSLVRSTGANSDDLFASTGNLSALTEAGNLVLSGTTIGTVTANSSGLLVLTFNNNATQAAVNETLQSITYANSSDAPPPSVQIDWTFDDGNTGAQGNGGSLQANGNTTVNISSVNDAPVLDLDANDDSGTPGLDFETTFVEGSGGVLIIDDDASLIDVDDADLVSLTVTLTNEMESKDRESLYADATGTSLNVNWDTSLNVLTISGAGTVEEYEKVLRTVGYDNTDKNPDLTDRVITFVANDGTDSSIIATTTLNITDVNNAPTLLNNSLTIDEGQSLVITPGDISATDAETSAASLSFSASNISGGHFAHSLTPAVPITSFTQGQITAGVILFVHDGLEAAPSYDLTVSDGSLVDGPHASTISFTNINDAPTISTIANQVIDEDANTGWISFTIGDAESDPGTLVITATSSDQTIIPDGNILFSGSGASRSILITPQPDQSGGPVTITVSVFDGTETTQTTFDVSVNPVNDGPAFQNLDDSPTFIENGSPVVLDPDVSVVDTELSGSNSFDGATLTLHRSSGANSLDRFSGTGLLGTLTEGGSLVYNSSVIGTVTTNSGGMLLLTFNSAANQTAVDGTLQSIAYSNSSEDPSGSVQIDWIFDDGNSGSQGSGGSLQTTGITTVNISAINDMPTLDLDGDNSSGGADPNFLTQFFEDGGPVLIADVDAVLSDVDSSSLVSLTVSISNLLDSGAEFLAANTTGTGISASYNSGSGVLTLSGTDSVANYEQVLRTVTYENTSDNPDTNVRTIFFVANDGSADSNPAVAAVTIHAVNDAPTNMVPTSETVFEETPTPIGSISISDVDANTSNVTSRLQVSAGTLNVTLVGSASIITGANGSSDLTIQGTVSDINASLANLVYTGNTDVSGANADTLVLTTDDGGNSGAGGSMQDVDMVQIDILPVNDPPIITSNGGGASANISVPENTTAVTTVTSSDVDGGSPIYSIAGGADAILFQIDSASGVLRFVAATDFENPADSNGDNIYEVSVQVNDGAGGTASQNILVTVTNVNEGGVSAVSDIDPNVNAIDENETAGTIVGVTAFGVDPDSADTVTYALIDDAGGRFTIDSNSGVVTTTAPLDAESATGYSIVVQAESTDGSIASQAFLIAVNDIDEFDVTPLNDVDATMNAVDENETNGTFVGITAFASDSDVTTNTVTYSLDDNAGGRFAIDSNSGVVSVADGSILDHESTPTHDIIVRATSADGSSITQVFTIAVNDVNEAPVITTNSVIALENQTTAGTLGAVDADMPGDTLTWSLTGSGLDDALFTIDSATGALTFDIAPNFENPGDADSDNVYEVQVAVNDGFLTSIRNITVTVVDANDSPVISTDTLVAQENQTNVGLLVGMDEDLPGDTLTWSIVGVGADDGLFSIDSSSGLLTFNSPPDFESPTDSNADNIYEVHVLVSDGTTSTMKTISVMVADSNDTPSIAKSSLTVSEGMSGNLDATVLQATDEDNLATELVYTITSGPSNGHLESASSPGVPVTSFTQAEIDAGQLVYIHDGSETTTDQITFDLTDGNGGSVSGQLFDFNIHPVNDAPLSVDDNYVVAEDQVASLPSVIANDVDAEGTALSPVLISGPSHAKSFTLNPDGTFQYTPSENYHGTDSFTYQASDGLSASSQSTVHITVTPVNDAPMGQDDAYSILQGELLIEVAGVLANDADVENDLIQAVLVNGPQNGVVFFESDGSFIYVPDVTFFGTDSFSYIPNDGQASGTLTTVTITVTSPGTSNETGNDDVASPIPDEPDSDSTSEDDPDIESSSPVGPPTSANQLADVPQRDTNNRIVASSPDEFLSIGGERIFDEVSRQSKDVMEWFLYNDETRKNQKAVSDIQLETMSRNMTIAMNQRQLWQQLDQLSDDVIPNRFSFDMNMSVAATTLVATAGYVIWSLRGGFLMATLISSLPTWTMVDPLPVLDTEEQKRVGGTKDASEAIFDRD